MLPSASVWRFKRPLREARPRLVECTCSRFPSLPREFAPGKTGEELARPRVRLLSHHIFGVKRAFAASRQHVDTHAFPRLFDLLLPFPLSQGSVSDRFG